MYFKKLDEVKAISNAKEFDAPTYAKNFYSKKLVPNLSKAIDMNTLIGLVKQDSKSAFDKYSHALGIGNIRYFLVQGSGTITAIDENDATISTTSDTTLQQLKIATEFVYGNAIRDASGLIDINEFKSTMDFNNVSAEINKIIRTTVIPQFKTTAKKGDIVKFFGAIELNQAHLKLDNLELIPISLNLSK